MADPTSLGSGGGDSTSGPGGTTGSNTTGTGSTGNTSTGTGGQAPQPATFELALTEPSSTLELQDSMEVEITIAENGYVGDVDLSVVGLDPEISDSLENTTVTLDGAGSTSVVLTLSTPSDATIGNYPFSITGSVAGGDKTTAGDVTVIPVITIYMPVNLNSFDSNPPSTNAFGAYPTVIQAIPNLSAQNPITVRFFNQDTLPHRIHASNPNQGFPHGDLDIPPNGFDPLDRQINAAGTFDYYPHDIGPGIAGRIVIQ